MRVIPESIGSSVCAVILCFCLVCFSRCRSFTCTPPAGSVRDHALRSGVVFEGEFEEELNRTERQVDGSRSSQLRVRVRQVWMLKAGGLLKDSLVSLIWVDGVSCLQLRTGTRYLFFMDPTNETSVFTAVFPPVVTKRAVRKLVSEVLCQECAEPKLKNLRSSTIEDGKKIILKCEVLSGNPAPTFKWYKNKTELKGKNKPKGLKIKKKKDGKTSELFIRKSTEADAGFYTCEAVNSLGKTNTSANITIIKAATSTTTSAKTSSHVTRCSESERNYCVNGGECFTLEVTPGNIRRLCRCPNEFTGDRCQNYVMASFYKHLGIEFMAEELYQKRVLTITGICIALLVVGIMCVVAYCKTKKQRKKLHDRLRQSLRERNAAAKGPPNPPPENLQLVNHYMANSAVPPHLHAMEKEAETSLSTNDFITLTHLSTSVTNFSSSCWSKTESVDSDSHTVTVNTSVENCRHHVAPVQRGRLNATGGSHQNSREAQISCSERYVPAITTPIRLSPVGPLSPVTPSSPPSEMSAPLSSLATSIPSMATSPSGEDERPLLFRTPPIMRDKSASNQARRSGHNLRNSAHYNHGLDLLSPPASPLHIEEDGGTESSHNPSERTQQIVRAAEESSEPGSGSNSASSSSESEDEDTPFLGLQNPLCGSAVLDGLEGNRTNPVLHLSPQEHLQSRLTSVMVNQDPIAV
ncbi:pro-neuregulin-1, membrane-bound isoform isoform X2 [Paramisgurnus dabryanus]|uniref:pro-neuregulin-1, membrane-bound isoform isoform X2 n=1 Tax=Paramisgurnus dabryanus TaxID=90735 RepID=UPI003CCF8084